MADVAPRRRAHLRAIQRLQNHAQERPNPLPKNNYKHQDRGRSKAARLARRPCGPIPRRAQDGSGSPHFQPHYFPTLETLLASRSAPPRAERTSRSWAATSAGRMTRAVRTRQACAPVRFSGEKQPHEKRGHLRGFTLLNRGEAAAGATTAAPPSASASGSLLVRLAGLAAAGAAACAGAASAGALFALFEGIRSSEGRVAGEGE